MIWPFTSSGGNAGSKAELDPTLQEFVKAQGPVSYSSSTSPGSPYNGSTGSVRKPEQSNAGSSVDPSAASLTEQSSSAPSPSSVPTLYPDGRYAHLWKTYRSQSTIEAENKSSSERIADVLLAYNDRDSSIKSAGLENCWAENMEVQKCNQNPPTAHDRFTLCRDYTRRLERCYVTQVRFLRALGYLAEPGRPQAQEEDIQLHADDLYRRMLAQEKLVEEAERDGRPKPVFAPVLASEISKAAGAKPVVVGTQAQDGTIHSPTLNGEADTTDSPALPPEASSVSEKTKRNMRERLKRLSPEERAIERLAMANEIRASNRTGKLWSEMALEQRAEREKRRQDGSASIGDRISGWLGW